MLIDYKKPIDMPHKKSPKNKGFRALSIYSGCYISQIEFYLVKFRYQKITADTGFEFYFEAIPVICSNRLSELKYSFNYGFDKKNKALQFAVPYLNKIYECCKLCNNSFLSR